MQVPLQPGIELVCNCRTAHRAVVTDEGIAPSLPAGCTGSYWSRPLPAGATGRVYGAAVSAGIVAPTGAFCAYLT